MKIATANATITTTLNPESIDISVYGTLYFVSGASDTIVGYQIDGGAAIPVLHLGPASGVLNAFGATVPATISAAAGSHTVNLMVCGPTTGQFVVGANNGATGISIKQISWA
jgi:hypothetical protein